MFFNTEMKTGAISRPFVKLVSVLLDEESHYLVA